MAFNLKLSFGPQWESVSIIRNFTAELLSLGIVNRDDAKKASTACSELIENVVKYSAAGGTMIDVTKDLGRGKIHLTIKNIASSKNVETFKTIFEEVTQGDPKEMYKKMMLRSFADPETSQLGLARIRYECQGTITYDVEDDIQSLSILSETSVIQADLKLLSVSVEIPVN
ncbi:MAG: hypothetical protein ABIJ31_06140 [Pseudomonadota bacterium]